MRFRLTDDQRALKAGVRDVLGRRFGPGALRAAAGQDRGNGPDPARTAGNLYGKDPNGEDPHGEGPYGGDLYGEGSHGEGPYGGDLYSEGSHGEGPYGRGRYQAHRYRLDRELWRALGDAGLFALRLPEADGGVGLGLPEAVLAFEEAGRALLPGPLLASHLAAGSVPGAASGETVVAEAAAGLVEWLAEADVTLGDTTDAVPVRSVDPLTPLHRVPHATTRPGPEAVLLTAAEQLGSAVRTCELAVQHARLREQFGRPIGAFQAVQHLCADLLVRTELARAAVYAAAVTADPADIAAARLLADEAAVRGARDCLQVHGGTGFTWESEVHLHLKRAWVRTYRTGDSTESEEVLARDLWDSGG